MHFKNLLCIIATSPLHRSDTTLTAGPYYLLSIDSKRYTLKRNPYYLLESHENCFEKINFTIIKEDKEAHQFHKGPIDVSCDTGLDFKYYLSNKDHSQLKENNAKLIMLLSPGEKFKEITPQVKHIIVNAIDRDNISRVLQAVPKPAFSYLNSYGIIGNNLLREEIKPLKHLVELEIAYENFYPNLEVITELNQQLLPYNIKLVNCEDEYGEWNSRSHLRFEIRKSIASTPLLLYRADISRGLLDSNEFLLARKYFSYLLQESNEKNQSHAYFQLDRIFTKSLVSVPLLMFPQWYFSKNHIVCNTLYDTGSFIQYRYYN